VLAMVGGRGGKEMKWFLNHDCHERRGLLGGAREKEKRMGCMCYVLKLQPGDGTSSSTNASSECTLYNSKSMVSHH